MVSPKRGDGLEGTHAGEHSDGEEIEQSGQRTLFAAWIPWVGQGSEEFAKGQWGIDDKASGARKHRKAS